MTLQRERLQAHRDAGPAASRAACGWMLTSFPTITPQTRVATAVCLLDDHELLALPVCEEGRFVGLVDDKALLCCTASELSAPEFREAPTLLARLTVAECLPWTHGIAVSPATPIDAVASAMTRQAARAVAVTQDGRPIGLLTWVFVLGPVMAGSPAGTAIGLQARTVQDWMLDAFPTISPRTTVATAIRLLQSHPTPVLPVCEKGRLLGLVDETALLRLTPSAATTDLIGEVRRRLENVPIGGRFVPTGPSVGPQTPLAEAAAVMMAESEEVIPVLDGGHLVGLLSWDRVMAAGSGETARHEIPARRSRLFWM